MVSIKIVTSALTLLSVIVNIRILSSELFPLEAFTNMWNDQLLRKGPQNRSKQTKELLQGKLTKSSIFKNASGPFSEVL